MKRPKNRNREPRTASRRRTLDVMSAASTRPKTSAAPETTEAEAAMARLVVRGADLFDVPPAVFFASIFTGEFSSMMSDDPDELLIDALRRIRRRRSRRRQEAKRRTRRSRADDD